ncbi:TetR/AcrR family transcriptional regulator [Novosphingobium album (ex Liu et al. 2023)]
MSAIADAVGGSKATMWAHFGSKEELFSAVVDSMVAQFALDIEDVLTSQSFSVPALRRFCLRFVDCLLRESAARLFRLIMGEGERFPELGEVFWTRGPAKMVGHVTDFYATRFPEDEARALAQITITTIVGYRSQALMDPCPRPPGDAERFIDNFIAFLKLDGAHGEAPDDQAGPSQPA